MSLRKRRRHKTKNHAQDCEMLGALPRQASGDPAMVSGFRMASILSRKYHGHLARFVQRAGLLLDVLVWGAIPSGNLSRCLRITPQGHDSFCLMSLRIIGFEGPDETGTRIDDAKTRAKWRAHTSLSSTTNVVLFQQRLVTRLVLTLDIVEERAARGDHFQQAAA